MALFPDFVPVWVAILFLVAIFFPIFMIAKLAKKGTPSAGKYNKAYLAVVGFYFVYLTYVSLAAFNGWFEEVSLPPKILKLTMMPLLGVLFLVVFNLSVYKKIVDQLPLSDLVGVHIFRLIGSTFLILGFYQALPSSIALIAGLGDVITAVSSVFVARAIQQNKPYARRLTWFWNTFGLLDILATSATALILTKLSIETGTQGVDALAVFPFCFIPAFAPATILFLHASVYRKLLRTQ
ncbi:MAG: hypothetical protein AAGJ93_14770 [Bacteroidota bacterium]